MPLTIGGGITNLEQVRNILRAGADKVAINSSAIENPHLISDISSEFGSQCCVVSIDVKRNLHSVFEVYTHGGKRGTGRSPAEWAQESQGLGAGEILLNSIDLDGSMQGYDIDLLMSVTSVVSIPTVIAGGAGEPKHFPPAFLRGKASGAAAASIFHFTSFTPMDVKKELHVSGLAVRL